MRNVRAERGFTPKDRFKLFINTQNPRDANFFTEYGYLLVELARLTELVVNCNPPADAHHDVVEGFAVSIEVPEKKVSEEQIQRTQKEIEKSRGAGPLSRPLPLRSPAECSRRGGRTGAGAALGAARPDREADAEPMIHLDTRRMVDRLKTIESLAVIPRVASTNLIARRIVAECIENELSLPQAMIIAEEQFAGIGRNARSWSSPAGKGIYATILLTRPTADVGLIPLLIANIVVTYLRDVFSIDAQIKWPNDILVNGKKIAGILIESAPAE